MRSEAKRKTRVHFIHAGMLTIVTTMFEGYYGRRRLKTTVAIVVGFLVLMALLHRRQSEF
jgi:hypothetical protein